MIQFLAEYGLFLLKTATIVIAIILIIGAAASASRKAQPQETLEVDHLNKRFEGYSSALKQAIYNKADWKAESKKLKEKAKADKKAEARPRVFVIDFKGDLKASAVPSLRQEVSAILEVAGNEDQVVVRLENYGGVVHEHGLADSFSSHEGLCG